MKYDIELPFPPTLNSYYVCAAKGRKVLARKGREYKEMVEEELFQQFGVLPRITESMKITIVLFPPDRRTRDLDNYLKGLLDSCTKTGIWDDDGLIDQLVVYRGETFKGGKVKMVIEDSLPIIPNGLPLDSILDS